jgi:hypothetical protein
MMEANYKYRTLDSNCPGATFSQPGLRKSVACFKSDTHYREKVFSLFERHYPSCSVRVAVQT